MACDVFIPYKPQLRTLAVVEQAIGIIAEYLDQGLKLTQRQLFYQFVARALIENTTLAYRRLRSIVCDARDGGLIDWDAMEDRTRSVSRLQTWDDPASCIRSASYFYREDLWERQGYRPEVWIEKAALLGVIESVCDELRVPYLATIGNLSQQLAYEAGKRFGGYVDEGVTPIVFHLGDHDPNGIDMTRDLTERLARYARTPIEVRRIALNLDQVRQHSPPPNFVKEGDARTDAYKAQFGTDECWELDALSPTVIVDLVRVAVMDLMDADLWERAEKREQRNTRLIGDTAANWTLVAKALRQSKDRR